MLNRRFYYYINLFFSISYSHLQCLHSPVSLVIFTNTCFFLFLLNKLCFFTFVFLEIFSVLIQTMLFHFLQFLHTLELLSQPHKVINTSIAKKINNIFICVGIYKIATIISNISGIKYWIIILFFEFCLSKLSFCWWGYGFT